MPNKNKVGSITLAQAEEIAKTKMPDLNAASLEAAVSMIKGTARSMGVTVEGLNRRVIRNETRQEVYRRC